MTLPLSTGSAVYAGRRVASGEATLPSLRAADGKLTGYHYTRPLVRGRRRGRRLTRRFLSIHRPRRTCVPAFSTPLAGELDLLGGDFFAIAHQETALPLARLQGERTRAVISCACLPGCYVGAMPLAYVLIPHSLTASPAASGSASVSDRAWPGGSVRGQQFSAGLFYGRRRYRIRAGGRLSGGGESPSDMATAELTAQAIVRAVAASGCTCRCLPT